MDGFGALRLYMLPSLLSVCRGDYLSNDLSTSENEKTFRARHGFPIPVVGRVEAEFVTWAHQAFQSGPLLVEKAEGPSMDRVFNLNTPQDEGRADEPKIGQVCHSCFFKGRRSGYE